MTEDFPAAHSMDAAWFAVDKNGHVAVFETGEPGPIPASAGSGQGLQYEMIDTLAAAKSGVSYYMADVLIPDGKVFQVKFGEDIAAGTEITLTSESEIFDCIIWFASEEALAKLGVKDAKRLPVKDAVVVSVDTIRRPLRATFEQLIQSGEIKRVWLGAALTLARFGFFTYEYGDYEAKKPYTQDLKPAVPIAADQLPQAARALLGGLVMKDKDFSRDVEVNPDDYGECHRWG